MPEVFNDEHRHTKLNATIVKQIKADRQNAALEVMKKDAALQEKLK